MQIPRGKHAALLASDLPLISAVETAHATGSPQDGRNLRAGRPQPACSNRRGFASQPGNGKMMNSSQQTSPIGGLHRFGALFIRVAVGLLLGSAITIAVVAAGLDLFPLHP
jgi:hypothetical protein